MVSAATRIFTVGHSSRPLDEFLGLLSESHIECVVDVRRLPGSRSFPHYNADALALSLSAHDIDYGYVPALCGRRTRAELGGATPESFWTNASFARYAAYARGPVFAQGLAELMERARHQHCAVMCAEAVWWRCHRRIIADHLLARGVAVCHIMGKGQITTATLTTGARLQQGEVIYPDPADASDA
ncbi:MAG: DUF488 domain-containing protein [Pseudoxanthomonas sp.]